MDASAEQRLIDAVHSADESGFASVVGAWSPVLVRATVIMVGDRSTAEDVVRRTWVRLLSRIGSFRPPPRLTVWFCALLLQEAGLDRGRRGPDAEGSEARPVVDPHRFLPPDHGEWPGHWATPPTAWPAMDDARAGRGVGQLIREALGLLPERQRVVVGLRDAVGCEVAEISHLVGLGAEDVRAELNRGRARVRAHLEDHLGVAGAS